MDTTPIFDSRSPASRPAIGLAAPVAMTRNAGLDRSLADLLSLQQPTGAWEGEMVWNTMILSQYVIVRALTGRPLDPRTRAGILQHYRVSANPDGSFGMHRESGGYVFFTTLAYVAMRLAGLDADEPMTRDARRWLHAQPGGVLSIPSWGKYWLAFAGLYDYAGCNPCPPEIYALPSWLPVHPAKYYCHTRNIYIGLAYLYGSRFCGRLGPLTAPLREELYGVDYAAIDFAAHRHRVAASDLHVAPGRGLRLTVDALHQYERFHSRPRRVRALAYCFDRIVYEQQSSRYQGLSPVNGLLNCLAIFSRGADHRELAPSLAGIEAWRWEDEREGIRYCGARSTTWDTALSIQAILPWLRVLPATAAGLSPLREPLQRAYRSLRSAQLTEELPRWRDEHRDPALGGFCFSDGQHRWPVSDCTAEAVCALLDLHDRPEVAPAPADRISDARLAQAAEFILYRQNQDGGFGTYERRRGGSLLEGINNTEMYGNCMTERSYLECTASSISALCRLRATLDGSPPHDALAARIAPAIARGVTFLRRQQRPDGSFPGFWGINFTYAAFHVVKALRAAGAPAEDPALQRAAAWLASKQRADGGWGEHYTSCLEDRYVERDSQAVMTSWALLSLLEIHEPSSAVLGRAVAFLEARRRADGTMPDEAQNGVFFGSAMLDYRLYKSYFPVWALGRHAALSSLA